MVGVRAKVLGRMGWTTSPYLRASALSCPSLVVYRTGALGSRPYHWPRCCLTLPRARPSLCPPLASFLCASRRPRGRFVHAQEKRGRYKPPLFGDAWPYRARAFGLRPFTASIGPASLYRRSCVSPLAAGGVEEPLDLLLESPHRESEFGLFVARSVILRPTLFALLQLLAAFQPLVVVLDHRDSSPARRSSHRTRCGLRSQPVRCPWSYPSSITSLRRRSWSYRAGMTE